MVETHQEQLTALLEIESESVEIPPAVIGSSIQLVLPGQTAHVAG